MFLTGLFRYQLLRPECTSQCMCIPERRRISKVCYTRHLFLIFSIVIFLSLQYIASHGTQAMDVNNLQGIERPGFHIDIHVTSITVIVWGPGVAHGCH